MDAPAVTIVMVARERFGLTRRSVESLYQHTRPPFALVVVDGGAPAPVRSYLDAEAPRRGFRLVRSDFYLAPNEARNLALHQVETPYVVFVDNDLVVSPGWLDALVECAEQTRAWVVGPVYCIGEPVHEVVHMAGGLARIREEEGRRWFEERHRHMGARLRDLRLRREPCELVEFHCLLARTEIFDRLGPLDEALLSTAEHVDLCLAVRGAGGAVYLEPRAVVTYLSPPPLGWSDLPYYLLRWSDSWNRATLDHFRRKWDLPAEDPCLSAHYEWLGAHRLLAYRPWAAVRGLLRPEVRGWLERRVLLPLEKPIHRRLIGSTRHTFRDPRTGEDRVKAGA